MLDGGYGDGSGARTRCTAGGGDEGWEEGDHFPNERFVPLAVETYGCLDSAFDGFLGTCARPSGRQASGRRFRTGTVGIQADLLLSAWSLNQLAA
jgi:hypothetical protein